MTTQLLKRQDSSRPAFGGALAQNNLDLTRQATTVLQINVGLLCNQACRHCHLEAGPDRTEVMTEEVIGQTVEFASRGSFELADVTGGAPELNPNLILLLEQLAEKVPKTMLRANLTALALEDRADLFSCLIKTRTAVTASLPALNRNQTDSQRGGGVFEKSLEVLKKLNSLGYGQAGSGLELNLVSNPVGAFLPPDQAQTENLFRRRLESQWGLVFNNLFNFANVPAGRFKSWLESSGNYDGYMDRLVKAFNPCSLEGVMCRSQVSVSWDGYLYDCDFNLALGLPLSGRKIHVSDCSGPPEPGTPIAVGDHCYSCTAGAGFT